MNATSQQPLRKASKKSTNEMVVPSLKRSPEVAKELAARPFLEKNPVLAIGVSLFLGACTGLVFGLLFLFILLATSSDAIDVSPQDASGDILVALILGVAATGFIAFRLTKRLSYSYIALGIGIVIFLAAYIFVLRPNGLG